MEEKEKTGGAVENAAEQSSDAGSEEKAVTPETPEARRARYRALVTGEFKDLYTADTQRIIDCRFKETRSLAEALERQHGVLAALLERYGAAAPEELEAAVEAHVEQARMEAQRQAEKRLADHIRSMGVRPQENGASAQNAVTSQRDVARLTRDQRAEYAKRAARGEVITFH